jgi:hypothetical protein
MLNLTSHDNFYLENFWENLIKVCERRRTFWCGIFVERFELLVRMKQKRGNWKRILRLEWVRWGGAGFDSNRNWESSNRGKSWFLSQLFVDLSCWSSTSGRFQAMKITHELTEFINFHWKTWWRQLSWQHSTCFINLIWCVISRYDKLLNLKSGWDEMNFHFNLLVRNFLRILARRIIKTREFQENPKRPPSAAKT